MFQPEMQGAGGGVLAGPVARIAVPDWRLRLRISERRELLGLGLGTDLAVDLGDAIGSRRWWLGLGACTALCGTAIALALRVPALPEPVRPGLTPAQRETAQPQAIAPLARGGATGMASVPNARLVEPLAEAPERPRLELTANFTGRDSFEGLLRRSGVGRDDIARVVALVRPIANLGALPKGTAFDLVLGRRETRSVPRPLELLGFRAAFDLRLALARTADGFEVRRIPIAVDSTPLRVKGLVGGNAERALRSAGVPARLASEYVKAMGYVVDFQHGVGKKDRFDIVIEQDRAETGEVRHGELLYASLDRAGKPAIELGRHLLGGKPQFFKADGESARKGLMRTPVDGARLTSGFGMRFHPLLAYSRMHQGVDFGAASGTPILAAASGTVAFAARHGGHGNYVLLKHSKDLNTGYAHMSKFAVRPGQSVSQGQVIGYVGSTGMSTGPHLHYEVWMKGRPINPVQLKFLGGTQLAGNDLAQFYAHMNRMRALAVTGGGAVVAAKATETRKTRGRPAAKA